MKQIKLTGYCLLLFIIPLSIKAQTMHAIIVANTFDYSIGSACATDYNIVYSEIKNIAQILHYNDNLVAFQDYDFSKENVETAIEKMQCANNDVIFFYYSGHGARAVNDNSKWPQMSFNSNNKIDNRNYVPLLKVFKQLKNKQPRLLIVIADCCNSVSNKVLPKNVMKGQTTVSDDEAPERVYKSLYNDLSGTILVSSSKPGEPSIALTDQNSLFTVKFFEAMADALNGKIKCDWETLLSESGKRTSDFSDSKQNPQCEIKVQSSNVPTPIPVPPVNDSPIALINELVNRKKNSVVDRINMINSVENNAFSSKNVVIETYAPNQTTLLNRETVDTFVKRLATTASVVRVIEIKSEKDASGKFESLKVHEIVKI